MFGKSTSVASKTLAGILAAAVVGALPAAAPAGRFENRHDWHDRDDHRGSRQIDIRIDSSSCGPAPPRVREERVWVEPVYRIVSEQHWVEPVYRTVCDRVWDEPVVRTETERVWVADRYEWREIVHHANGHRYVRRESVLVEPAHWADQTHECVITPGHYEDRPRQELVCGGHWETRPVIIESPRYDRSHAWFGLGIPLGR